MMLKGKPRSEDERAARYQPPPLVKKRRMKRSCSERELLVLILSMETSEDEGETLGHLRNCMDRRGVSSMKIALRIRVPRRTPRGTHTIAPLQSVSESASDRAVSPSSPAAPTAADQCQRPPPSVVPARPVLRVG